MKARDYQLLPGDYGVVRTSGFIGAAIRFFTRSEWNHAFIYIGDEQIVEAQPKGAVISPLKDYDEGNLLAFNYREKMTYTNGLRVAEQAKKLVGIGYNFIDIFVIFLKQFGFNHKWINKRVSNDGRLICSQLVDLAYQNAGIHLFDDGRYPGDVTPADLGFRPVMGYWPDDQVVDTAPQ